VKVTNSLTTIFIVAAVLFTVGFACGDDDAKPAANTTASNTATTSNTATAPSAKSIAGSYDAEGTNPDGAGTYKASLVVKAQDDVYQFSWNSAGKAYDGVGVMTDNAVAVSYTNGSNGKGCGVVLYKIGSDGSLDGKAGYWGVNKAENEKATRKSGTDLDGDYEITGKNPDGKEYKGSLKVAKEGLGYSFKWNAGAPLEGFGIRAGNLVAVGFGGKQCAFVGYDVKPDGTLDGRWGDRTSKKLGTEVAKLKK